LDGEETKQQPSDTVGSVPSTAPKTNDSADEQEKIDRDLRDIARQNITLQKWMVGATVGIAITTGIYVVVTALQWRELQSANHRTDALIKLGNDNLQFAKQAARDARADTNRTLKAAEDQADAITSSIGPATLIAADAAKASALAARQQAIVLEDQRKTTRLELRAKFTSALMDNITPEAGKQIATGIHIQNTGKIQADVTVCADIFVANITPTRPSDCKPIAVDVPIAAMGSGHYWLWSEEAVPSDMVDEIRNGNLQVYVIGYVNWQDAFGGGSFTFCNCWKRARWTGCSGQGDAMKLLGGQHPTEGDRDQRRNQQH